VYFDRLPTSEAVAVCGGVQITLPRNLHRAPDVSAVARWRRAMLKLTTLHKDEAQATLLDLPEVFGDVHNDVAKTALIEIRLFEFDEVGRRVVHPALLVRE